MENSLHVGDMIMINRLAYGPKFPRGKMDIPWLNTFSNKISDDRQWPYFRLPGFTDIKRNDIVVFKKYKESNSFLVKRCIGVCGDRIQLKNGSAYVNGNLITNENVKKAYVLYFERMDSVYIYARENKILYQNLGKKKGIKMYLSAKQLGQIKKIDGFRKDMYFSKGWPFFRDKFEGQQDVKFLLDWTTDNFGPIIIPKKGLKIRLDANSIFYYSDLIIGEDPSITSQNKSLYRYGLKINQYVFKKDYYFFLGDNRSNSQDSRYWGFVCSEDIEGKVAFSF